MVGADAQRAAELFATQDERRNRFLDTPELGLVGGVGVFEHGELLFVGVVARVDADFFDVLDGLHGGGGQEVDVGHERHVGEAGGGEFFADGLEAARGLHVGRGHADDLAADLGEGDGLAHRRLDVLGVARGHGLHAQGIGAAHANGADLHLAGATADGVEAGQGVGQAHGAAGKRAKLGPRPGLSKSGGDAPISDQTYSDASGVGLSVSSMAW